MVDAPLLRVRDLVTTFRTDGGVVRAVDGVSFSLARGRTLGLVGESGCGKSTLGRCILRLYDADRGEVRFDGLDLIPLTDEALVPYRRRMQVGT